MLYYTLGPKIVLVGLVIYQIQYKQNNSQKSENRTLVDIMVLPYQDAHDSLETGRWRFADLKTVAYVERNAPTAEGFVIVKK